MVKYSDNMSEEKKPFSLMPEGHRQVRILEMIDGKSKSGNRMFTVTLEDIKTKSTMVVYLVAEPKKRWMLKSLLSAIGVSGGENGVYEYDTEEIIGKRVTAIVEHYKEPWINREGQEVTSTKAKVTEFLQEDLTPQPEMIDGKPVVWDE